MGVSVEEFHAFGGEGWNRIDWVVRGMTCNMTIGKTVGEMYLHGRELWSSLDICHDC